MSRPLASVTREPHLPGSPGICVYAQNPSYARVSGTRLVEAVKHEAMLYDERIGRQYYHPRIYRRLSDDNGQTWREQPDFHHENPHDPHHDHRHMPSHVLDAARDVLISVHGTYQTDPTQSMFARGSTRQRTTRMWYELSFDGGDTWTEPRQIIDRRPGYDANHWAPGTTFGESGAIADLLTHHWLPDGSLVLGLTQQNVSLPGSTHDEGVRGVRYARGRWNATGDGLEWQLGDIVVVPADKSVNGGCEPAVTSLGGERLFNVMRCQGSEASGIHATRYTTTSDDGGMTWSDIRPLRYDTGDLVWTPASLSSFITSSVTGRTYWLANILPSPVHGQTPRYPLCIAEFDPRQCCIVKSSVQVIQARTPGLPEEVRYTNWGAYEDRGSGDLMLTCPEQPKLLNFTETVRPEDFTADCHRYRLRLA